MDGENPRSLRPTTHSHIKIKSKQNKIKNKAIKTKQQQNNPTGNKGILRVGEIVTPNSYPTPNGQSWKHTYK